MIKIYYKFQYTTRNKKKKNNIRKKTKNSEKEKSFYNSQNCNFNNKLFSEWQNPDIRKTLFKK